MGAAALVALVTERKVRPLSVLLLAAVILFEYQAAWPFPTVPANIPQGVARLRELGHATDLGLHPERAKKFFDRANKAGAEHAIFLGSNEVRGGEFTIKSMSGGESRTARLESIA
ncbi:MAG: hypothetical protein HC825_11750 [Oscillatoriales cyanobacterium RM1_1_9]|nr:hypothetical protein [Oscillatoriales cyanobacterium RM1_1_9]